MSKRRALQRLAKDAGVISPVLKYSRQAKMWAVQSEMPNPNGVGIVARSVGSYATVADAAANLPAHWKDFQRAHGIGEFAPTDDDAPTDDLPELPTDDDTPTDDDDHHRTITALLTAIATTTDDALTLPINDATRDAARYALEHLTPTATRYKTTTPGHPKARVRWKQPLARRSPVYTHEIECAVCGAPYAVQTHSPNAPATCDNAACATEHNRALARERMRRYRQRKRGE